MKAPAATGNAQPASRARRGLVVGVGNEPGVTDEGATRTDPRWGRAAAGGAALSRLRGRFSHAGFFVGAVALSCIGIFVLVSWNLLLARNAAEDAALRTVENLAALAAHDAESEVAAVDVFMRGVESVVPGRGAATLTAAQYAVLAALAAQQKGLRTVVIVDALGRPLHAIAPPDGATAWPPDGFASAEWFVAAVGDPSRLVVGAPTAGLSGEAPVLPIARALTGPDGVRAVVMAELDIAALEDFLGDIDLGADGVLWILWRGETIVLRVPSVDGRGETGTSVAGSANSRHYLAAPQGTYRGVSAVDGVERLYAFRALGDLPLILGVGASADAVGSDWRQLAIASIAITAALCSAIIVIALLLRREISRRNAVERDLVRLSETDPLTGLANRRRFEQFVDVEIRRARRNRSPLSVLMIDVDRFKLVNDRLGHAYGDMVLKAVAGRLQASIRRPADLAARIGGDEFALVLPETGGGGADNVAETARQAVERYAFPESGHITITVGVATIGTDGTMSATELIAAADHALYAAKEAGRNRSIRWTGTHG